MGKNVIVACDFSEEKQLVEFLDKMEKTDPNFYCKVGMKLFYSGALNGFYPVRMIKDRGHKVFLDLKLKDIPNTVAGTAEVLAKSGVDMINVHADGGFEMMKQVVDTVNGLYEGYKREYERLEGDYSYSAEAYKDSLKKSLSSRPLLLGVTVLTSMNEEVLRKEIGVNKTPMEQVVSLAMLCKKAGFDGVVCSPKEIMAVKEACGEDFITVTPGIRFADSKKDDQERVATPACANIMGSDYIVVGRPIIEAEDVVAAYNRCKKDFTEKVTDEVEIENAKKYIEDLKATMPKKEEGWILIEPNQNTRGGVQKRK